MDQRQLRDRTKRVARSDKEFCSKLAVVVEEADESQLWLERLPEAEPKIATDGHKACSRKRQS